MWNRLTLGVVVVYSAAVLLVFRDYGVTFDEHWQAKFGDYALAWYESGFSDRRILSLFNFMSYGSFFDLTAQWLARHLPFDMYESRHLAGGLCSVATLSGVIVLTRRLAGPRAGFIAALFGASTPHLFGHGFNNAKDVPFAAAFVWGMAALIDVVRLLPRPPFRKLLFLGLMTGLALGVRIGGMILLVYLALMMLYRIQREHIWTLFKALVVVALSAWMVKMVFNPAYQVYPLSGPWISLKKVWHGSTGTFPVFFGGRMIENDDLPRSYVWVWLVRTLPDVLFCALAAGVAAAARAFYRRTLKLEDSRFWLLVVVAALFPFVMVTITRPVLYDGIRHFLFCTLLLLVLGAAGTSWLLENIKSSRQVKVLWSLLLLGCGITLYDMVRLHPYQTIYFNRLVGGGLGHSGKLMETDYWGNAFREGTLALNEKVHPRNGVRPRVISSCFTEQTTWYLDQMKFEYAGSFDFDPEIARDPDLDPPDYYIGSTRWNRHDVYPGEVIYRVQREGITLLLVVKVDKEAARARRDARRPRRRTAVA